MAWETIPMVHCGTFVQERLRSFSNGLQNTSRLHQVGIIIVQLLIVDAQLNIPLHR